jgi:hypothetical protein
MLRDTSQYDGWGVSKRPPEVGETGTLIDVLHAPGLPDHYVVEKTDSATGLTIWLADFEKEELEAVCELSEPIMGSS